MGGFVAFGFFEMVGLASEESGTMISIACKYQALWRCIRLRDPAALNRESGFLGG